MVFERYFTLFVALCAVAGVVVPGAFLWLKPYLSFMLGIVMFGIGLTVSTEQLKALAKSPAVVGLALGKFIAMPLLAYAIGIVLRLPPEQLIGMVILGACPGGVAANVMSYLSKSNTALAVLLTILTTLLSPLITPWIIYAAFHQQVSFDVMAMMEKLFWVVLMPLLDAIIIRRFFAKKIARIEWVFPPISMLDVGLIVAYVAAANRETLLSQPWLVLLAVTLFNLGGYVAGYITAWLCRYDRAIRQAVAFEYGIQDSALGVIIATGFFSSLAALPSAICSLLQNITGPMLARWFTRLNKS